MIDRLDEMLRFQTDALKLRAQRQTVLAANIANADTPNYKAVDFDFAKALASAQASGGTGAADAQSPDMLYRQPSQSSLDGNTVDMDAERGQFADNTVRYEAALRVLSAQIKTMLAAVQG
ncbi:MAG: flagellar basal body rod protein FlgB [Betaproteobacteria bacterium]